MKVLSFGEVLWDVYPDKKVIGGAPLNFAGCFSALGGESRLLSAVGNDELGIETVEAVKAMGVNASYIGIAAEQTGVCNVSVDKFGSPTYSLKFNTAYDNIPLSSECFELALNGYFDALYFGTLAQRCPGSKSTLNILLSSAKFKEILFDVNFRSSFYDKETVENGLHNCTVLKFSREEAGMFYDLGIVPRDDCPCSGDPLKSMCRYLFLLYNIPVILVSLDKDGGFLFNGAENSFIFSEKPKADVVSTVGGGDCFSASFLYFKMLGEDYESCLNKAVRLSSFVVSSIESVPAFPAELIESVKGIDKLRV